MRSSGGSSRTASTALRRLRPNASGVAPVRTNPRVPKRGVLSQFERTTGRRGCGSVTGDRRGNRVVRNTAGPPPPAFDPGADVTVDPAPGRLVQRDLQLGVEPARRRRPSALRLAHEVETGETGALGEPAPLVGELTGSGQVVRPVHEEQRPAVDPEVARVLERREDRVEVAGVVVGPRVGLRDEHAVAAGPDRRPVLVRPAEAEREVGLAAREHLVERALEQPATGEPVVPVAERLDAVRGGRARPARRASRGAAGRRSRASPGSFGWSCPGNSGRARATFVHSVKPGPHHSSFSGMGWNCGR